ncbi:MAG: hypothetical protein CMH79_04780 [Nitrospinae bacterium]|nr:hypothetical protein [Nitrospinota bacterium]
MLQRRKASKYRKKKTYEEKERLKSLIRKQEIKNLPNILYQLPIEIKIKIFRMSIQLNMYLWKMDHYLKYCNGLYNFYNYNPKGNLNISQLRIQQWPKGIDNHRICLKNVDKPGNPGINEVYVSEYLKQKFKSILNPPEPIFNIDNPITNIIPLQITLLQAREWSNKPNYYWYHNKCRCLTCDKVRYIGYKIKQKNISHKERNKYKRIKWGDNNNQWKPY